jgi:hypothetical protein
MSVIKKTADAEQRLKELCIDLPQPPKPLGSRKSPAPFKPPDQVNPSCISSSKV